MYPPNAQFSQHRRGRGVAISLPTWGPQSQDPLWEGPPIPSFSEVSGERSWAGQGGCRRRPLWLQEEAPVPQ